MNCTLFVNTLTCFSQRPQLEIAKLKIEPSLCFIKNHDTKTNDGMTV